MIRALLLWTILPALPFLARGFQRLHHPARSLSDWLEWVDSLAGRVLASEYPVHFGSLTFSETRNHG